jgi:hypothetical protein
MVDVLVMKRDQFVLVFALAETISSARTQAGDPTGSLVLARVASIVAAP